MKNEKILVKFENEHEMRNFLCEPCLLHKYNLEIFTEKKKKKLSLTKYASLLHL